MNCEHKRLISTNCVLSCLDCGAVLPEGFQTAKKQANFEPEGEKPVKSHTRKKPVKKTE